MRSYNSSAKQTPRPNYKHMDGATEVSIRARRARADTHAFRKKSVETLAWMGDGYLQQSCRFLIMHNQEASQGEQLTVSHFSETFATWEDLKCSAHKTLFPQGCSLNSGGKYRSPEPAGKMEKI